MSKYDKLLFQILRGTADANIPFDDLRVLLQKIGFEEGSGVAIISFARKAYLRKSICNARGIRPKSIKWAGTVSIAKIQARRRPMTHKYEIIIYWSNEDQVFVAEAPELPGCMAHGDTHESAL